MAHREDAELGVEREGRERDERVDEDLDQVDVRERHARRLVIRDRGAGGAQLTCLLEEARLHRDPALEDAGAPAVDEAGDDPFEHRVVARRLGELGVVDEQLILALGDHLIRA